MWFVVWAPYPKSKILATPMAQLSRIVKKGSNFLPRSLKKLCSPRTTLKLRHCAVNVLDSMFCGDMDSKIV